MVTYHNPTGENMMDHTTGKTKGKYIIDEVGVTSEALTGRGGLSLFVRYLRNIGIYAQLQGLFGSMRRSKKGLPIGEVFKQLLWVKSQISCKKGGRGYQLHTSSNSCIS